MPAAERKDDAAQSGRWSALKGYELNGLSRFAHWAQSKILPVTHTQYVIIPCVEKATTLALRLLPSHAITINDFNRTCQNALQFSTLDSRVLLKHLERSRQVTIRDDYIKAISKGDITDTDMTTADLRSLHEEISTQISSLEHARDITLQKVKSSLTSKSQALRYLRKTKLIEASLDNLLDRDLQVQQVLMQIEKAAGNADLMTALEHSERVLAQYNKGAIERAESITDTLRDEMMNSEEVDRILASVGGENVDSEELEAELRKMQDDDSKDTVQKLAQLKLVPNDSPKLEEVESTSLQHSYSAEPVQ